MQTDRLIIRPLCAGDAAAYAALRLSAIDEAPASFLSTRAEEEQRSLDDIEARICETANRVVFGAFAAGSLVAVAGLRRYPVHPVHQKGFLWGLFVAQVHRRGGIARQLVAAVIDQARAMGLSQIALHTDVQNASAIALYKSSGFETVDEASDDDDIDDDTDRELEMVLKLD